MELADLLNQFTYHPPRTKERADEHESMRATMLGTAMAINELPDSREKLLALTKVEEALFWANAAIARQGN